MRRRKAVQRAMDHTDEEIELEIPGSSQAATEILSEADHASASDTEPDDSEEESEADSAARDADARGNLAGFVVHESDDSDDEYMCDSEAESEEDADLSMETMLREDWVDCVLREARRASAEEDLESTISRIVGECLCSDAEAVIENVRAAIRVALALPNDVPRKAARAAIRDAY